MVRWLPEVRALYERVRRPARMLVAGLLLMTPAATMVTSEKQAEARVERSRLAAKADTAAKAEAQIASAWQEKAVEREREKVTAVFADRFEIPRELAEDIHAAALENDLDPKVAFGLVRTESSFRRNIVSSAGAVGYTQLLPSTARWIQPGVSRRDLFEPETNLRVGFKYLKKLIDRYDGDVRLALTAYNRGPGTVDRELKRGRNPDNGYYEMVVEGKDAHASGHQRKMKVKAGRSRRS